MSQANRLPTSLNLMSISMSEARISPLRVSFPPFVFRFNYADGNLLIDTNDPAEAG